jgi:hypothetical protein
MRDVVGQADGACYDDFPACFAAEEMWRCAEFWRDNFCKLIEICYLSAQVFAISSVSPYEKAGFPA